MTFSLLVLMDTWNDFLLAPVMNPSGRVFTAPLALSFFAGSRRTTDQTVVAAAAVLVAPPSSSSPCGCSGSSCAGP